MMGETVTVFVRGDGELDEMGDRAKVWTPVEVDNVLVRVAVGGSDGDAQPLRPDSAALSCTLAFPKSSPVSGEQLRGARVALTGRGCEADPDKALSIVGEALPTVPCPTFWNMLAKAVREDG